MNAIAIDGPAGSGKSTIARALAEQLGYTYIDTGAMYRSATYKALQAGVAPADPDELVELIRTTEIRLSGPPSGQRVLLDGEDVTEEIRRSAVTGLVSAVSQIPGIREIMVEKQRDLARCCPVVMDGRDVGTQVLPDAPHKFFLTATLEERARRRQADLERLSEPATLEDTIQEIARRDRQDETRKISPLRQARDAIRVDTTGRSVEEVLREILSFLPDPGSSQGDGAD